MPGAPSPVRRARAPRPRPGSGGSRGRPPCRRAPGSEPRRRARTGSRAPPSRRRSQRCASASALTLDCGRDREPTRLAGPADLRRGRQPGGHRRRRARAPSRGAPAADRRRQLPDGTGEIADRLAAEHEDIAVLHRDRKQGLGPAYVAGFHAALAGGAGLIAQMDADFSHDPGTCRACSRRPSGPTSCSGPATWSAAAWPTGADAAADQPRRVRVRAGDARGRHPGPDRRLQGLSPRGPGADRLEAIPSLGYAFQVETTYRAIRRVPRHRGADRLSRPSRGRVEDERLDRGRGRVPNSYDAPGASSLAARYYIF